MFEPQTITPTFLPMQASFNGPNKAAVAMAPAGSTAIFISRTGNVAEGK